MSKKIVLLLAVCAAGTMVPLQAGPCVSGALLSAYVGTSCDIGLYTFTFGLDAWTIQAPGGSSTTPVGGLTADDVVVNTLLNENGTGFLLTPTVAWTATGGGTHTDSELKYVVSGAGINRIYLEVDGNVAPNGFSHVLEQYCLGGTTSPPAGDGNCFGSNNNNPTGAQYRTDATIVGINGPGDGTGGSTPGDGCSDGQAGNPSVAVTPTGAGPSACGIFSSFADQTTISVLKDIDVNGGDGTGNGDFAQITGVVNQFGPSVPEPATYVMSVLGLGLIFLGRRKISRS